ncbi:MAG: hypothetical protein OQK73_05595 [Gammaproteobacteria bacterium]|nr:hypothetical protein [Gammaproteobacteria bacterium]
MISNPAQNTECSSVSIPVTYYKEWQDGFGAQGWKLNCSMDDPFVIASTAETGPVINTSVLIHDMLDHYLCGLPMSGHRNEAIALIQLASRTGTDPRPDFTQMVDEDLMHGNVTGEPLFEFISEELQSYLPFELKNGQEIIQFLGQRIGKDNLRQKLVQCFFDIGLQNSESAKQYYEKSGLDYQRRKNLGLALQKLLCKVDQLAEKHEWDKAAGMFFLKSEACALNITYPQQVEFFDTYQ